MPEPSKDSCYQSSDARHDFIEFHFDEHHRKAFNAGHLITYSLDPNSGADHGKDDPPERLHLAFSTADVYIFGWRLSLLADNLCGNKLYAVAVRPRRYATLEERVPYVTAIEIKPIGTDEDQRAGPRN